jgi:hypothetical protein
MLGIFGKKSGHPMADLKSAQQLLEELPKNDALKALVEINAWVASVRNDSHIRLDTRFAVLSLLDETARPHEIKVLRDYFSSGVSSPVLEKRQWNALNDHYTELAEAYHSLLIGCHNGEKGASSLKSSRPLIVARGINATAGCLKCAAVRYAPVMPELWAQLGEYYAEAETQKCLDEALALYPGSSTKCTPRHQLAGVLLWWLSGTGSFKPLQIHLAERLTAHMCSGLTMGPEHGEDTLYSFDLMQPRPPARFGGNATAQPSLRFIGYGAVRAQLDPLLEKLEKDMVPGEVNLGGTYGVDEVREVAKRLAAAWHAEPPSRRHVRRNLDVSMSVVRGYSGLLDVANSAAEPGENGIVWVAEDVSATGFRCILDAAQGTGLKVGSLVGFRPENVRYWGAGIVRRLRRDELNKIDVGVEILANRAARVKLGEEEGTALSAESFGLWLVQSGWVSGEARILLKPGNVDENRTLRVQMNGKSFMLMPQGLLEKGDDFDLMKYRAMEREE